MVTRLALALALLGAVGCESTTALSWRITFADASDRGDTRRLTATVRRGGCDGEVVYETNLVSGASPSMDPPDLEPGSYAFAAEAYDADCRLVAEGCVEVQLPEDGDSLELSLASADRRSTCDGVCRDGLCSACEGGVCPMMDGGVDAGPGMDAGEDAGSEEGEDAGGDAGADAGGDGGADAGPMLDPPEILSPWTGWSSGAAIAPVGSGPSRLSNHPLAPEIRWREVTGAMSYLVELVRCDSLDPAACDFSAPTARVVTDDRTFRARPPSLLPVELTTAPLGARYAFRVGACAEPAGRACFFAAPRRIEVGRAREDIDGDAIGDLFLVGETAEDQELRRATASGTSAVTSAPAIRAVSWVGDYDGDGVGELAMTTDGAPGGRVVFLDDLVVAGTADESTGGAALGASLTALDDVDGDGYADFAASVVGEAEVRVFLGGPAFDAARAVTVPAPSGVTEFGAAIAGVGDRDADGLADLAVTARVGTDSGRVYVYSLAGRAPTEIARQMLATGEVSGGFGPLPLALAGGADMDDDGTPEIVVGRPRLDSVVILFGDGTLDSIVLEGEAGTSVAIGDLDGTGGARAIAGGPTAVDPDFGQDGTSWHIARDAGSFFAVRIRFIDFSSMAAYGREVSVLDFDGNGRQDPVVLDGAGASAHVVFYDPGTMRIDPGGELIIASGGISRWVHVVR